MNSDDGEFIRELYLCTDLYDLNPYDYFAKDNNFLYDTLFGDNMIESV